MGLSTRSTPSKTGSCKTANSDPPFSYDLQMLANRPNEFRIKLFNGRMNVETGGAGMPTTIKRLSQQIHPVFLFLGSKAPFDFSIPIFEKYAQLNALERSGVIDEILRIFGLGTCLLIELFANAAYAHTIFKLHPETGQKPLQQLNSARFFSFVQFMSDPGGFGTRFTQFSAHLEDGCIGSGVTKLARIRANPKIQSFCCRLIADIAGVEKEFGKNFACCRSLRQTKL